MVQGGPGALPISPRNAALPLQKRDHMLHRMLHRLPETGLWFLSTRFRRMRCRGRWRTVYMMHKNIFKKPCPKEGIGTFCHALFMVSCDRSPRSPASASFAPSHDSGRAWTDVEAIAPPTLVRWTRPGTVWPPRTSRTLRRILLPERPTVACGKQGHWGSSDRPPPLQY